MDSIVLDEKDIEERFVARRARAGQNVNKVSTAVELRFNVGASSLPDEVKDAPAAAGRQPYQFR